MSRATFWSLPWGSRSQHNLAAKSCPAHNFVIWSPILKLFHRNDHHIASPCRGKHLGRYLEGQGHSMTVPQKSVRPITLLFEVGFYNYLIGLIINGKKQELMIIKELFEGPIGEYCITSNTIKCLLHIVIGPLMSNVFIGLVYSSVWLPPNLDLWIDNYYISRWSVYLFTLPLFDHLPRWWWWWWWWWW